MGQEIRHMCVYLLSGDLLRVEELDTHTTHSTKLSDISD